MCLPSQRALLRQHIRAEIRQRRRLLTPAQQQACAQQVARHIAHHPRVQHAQAVALFLAFDGELDTRLIIQQLWQQQKHVYLPVLHPFNLGHLLFLRYTAGTQLIFNRLKIWEPRLDVQHVLPVELLDVMLTPLLAFDCHGHRLGMGGGYYDRTLQHWQQCGPYPIGLAHDCQQVANLPTEQWDISLPEIVTPSKIWKWG